MKLHLEAHIDSTLGVRCKVSPRWTPAHLRVPTKVMTHGQSRVALAVSNSNTSNRKLQHLRDLQSVRNEGLDSALNSRSFLGAKPGEREGRFLRASV
jgi:hypothetical protein